MIEVHIPLVFFLHHTTKTDLALNGAKYMDAVLFHLLLNFDIPALRRLRYR
jgi:hypothetical protein